MRVFELTTHLKSISRGTGRSATAAAAYRACCAIACEREGRTHDYRRKTGLETAEIAVPADAPDWAQDRGKLWNAAELRERNKDPRARDPEKLKAKSARELLFTFPAELSQAGRLNAARTIARHLVGAHEVAADFSIHQPGRDGDMRNYHCHLMMTTRRLSASGLGKKAREWDDLKTGPALAKKLRAFVAGTLNAALAAEGKAASVHVEHRSFKERGEPQRPTIHEGPGRTNMQRRLRRQTRDAWQGTVQSAQAKRHGEERAALKVRQDFALQTKVGALAERERQGIAAIRDRLRQDQAADRPPTGIRRTFDNLTGRAMRDDFARQTRAAERTIAADRAIDALKADTQKERADYATAQVRETRTLADKHRQEDQQVGRAADTKVRADRAAEVQARRDRVRGPERSRGIERDGPGRTPTLH